jgi:hypothetical protein
VVRAKRAYRVLFGFIVWQQLRVLFGALSAVGCTLVVLVANVSLGHSQLYVDAPSLWRAASFPDETRHTRAFLLFTFDRVPNEVGVLRGLSSRKEWRKESSRTWPYVYIYTRVVEASEYLRRRTSTQLSHTELIS